MLSLMPALMSMIAIGFSQVDDDNDGDDDDDDNHDDEANKPG